jgi:DNA-binding NarL/FixJ family response regulator
MKPIRVLIADDHPLFRDGMHGLLASVSATEVVGEAETGDDAIRLAGELIPNVILMDIKMPGENGISATRQILSAYPQIKILIVTMFEDDDSIFAAMRAGANGYLLKDSRQDEVLRAIQAVANGEAIFSPGVARRMMGFFKSSSRSEQLPAFPELSEREQEILSLIARGMSNAEIAAKLVLSLKTVQNHVSNILNKLQVADRVQAAIRAREAGLG